MARAEGPSLVLERAVRSLSGLPHARRAKSLECSVISVQCRLVKCCLKPTGTEKSEKRERESESQTVCFCDGLTKVLQMGDQNSA